MPRGTVLLAERDEALRSAHRLALQGAGYRVVEAGAGEDVIRLAHQTPPSVVVMQCSLSGVSGLRAAEVLKDEPGMRSVPILLLGTEEEELREAREAGCDAYLSAICRPGWLLREVQWLTRSAERRGRA